MNFKVEWTGSYPCLCFGEWVVKYKEQELELPEEIASESMNTYGTYGTWYFTEEWSEVFENYQKPLRSHRNPPDSPPGHSLLHLQ